MVQVAQQNKTISSWTRDAIAGLRPLTLSSAEDFVRWAGHEPAVSTIKGRADFITASSDTPQPNRRLLLRIPKQTWR